MTGTVLIDMALCTGGASLGVCVFVAARWRAALIRSEMYRRAWLKEAKRADVEHCRWKSARAQFHDADLAYRDMLARCRILAALGDAQQAAEDKRRAHMRAIGIKGNQSAKRRQRGSPRQAKASGDPGVRQVSVNHVAER